ncbi:GIY-YIG nuclease family protein [Vogesella indigofera]|uniref:GIY-YIG nuclease family protein n=1 Tax=Vogesella indigofera TaxID=45465 RepID=UPI00234E2BF7|nr:GIY-YIG nuclease family protein [Vogesella indigofera]
MSWYLYLLECRGGSLYTGISNNVEKRYAAHVAGKGARYTRSFPPERIALVLEFADKGEALRAELAVKAMSAAQKRAWLAAHSSDNVISPANQTAQ